MNLTKNVRFFSILVLTFLSLVLIIYPFIIKKDGVIVVSAASDTACPEIFTKNALITSINGESIKDSQDFYSSVKELKGRVSLIVNDGPRICNIEDKKVNVQVKDVEVGGVKFGYDIGEGIEFKIKTDSLQKEIPRIEKRLDYFNLKNYELTSSNEEIKIIFNKWDAYKAEDILRPGYVEANLLKLVETKNGTIKFGLNDKVYEGHTENQTLKILGKDYKIGDLIILDGIQGKIQNITENYTAFFFHVFDGSSVSVSRNFENRIMQTDNIYQYVLSVDLTKEASENFEKVTKGQSVLINPHGENYLQDPIIISIDGDIITSFPILQADSGKPIQKMIIFGSEENMQKANEKLEYLTGFIKSGKLDIEIIEKNIKEPKNRNLTKTVFLTTIGIITTTSGIVLIKKGFRSFTTVLIGSLIEIILFFGVAASQIFAIILFLITTAIAAFESDGKWFKWIGILLAFLIAFGAVESKMLLTTKSIIGFFVGFGLSMALTLLIIIKEIKKEKFLQFFWKFSFPFFALMTIMFFTKNFRELAMGITIAIIIGIFLVKPEYFKKIKE